MLKEIHLAGSVRTPFGSFCGAFAEVSTVELGKAALERSGVKPEDVKELPSILLALTEATLEKSPMSDNTNKAFDQVAAFQKLWTDSFANMASVWSQFSPGSPPSDEMRKMRGGMLKVLAETWDEYMRTPQFMEMMKGSLSGVLDLKRMARDGMNRVHEQFENPSKEDIDGVLMAIRHAERRLLDRLEGLDDRVANLDEKIDKVDQQIAKHEKAFEHRLANLDEKIDKVDQRIATHENAIKRRGQISKTKAQKPAATTGAKHSPSI